MYDQGAPNGGLNPASGTGYNLATTVTVTAAGTNLEDIHANGNPVVLSKTVNSYDPVVSGTGSGWEFAVPTKVVTGFGSTTSTSVTVLDAEGRVTQTRQPSEATTGTGPGTRRSVYYSAGANSSDAACGNKPAWAGLVCLEGPMSTPATGFPTERTTGYSMWLAPTTTVETSNGATRTTTTTYDTASRPVQVATATSGLTGASPVPDTRTTYSQTTGAVTKTESVHSSGSVLGTISHSYDDWGRLTGYTNAQGETTTTSYDSAGRVATLTDPNGTVTYTYDGTDGLGRPERRGLPTKVVHATGGRSFILTGAYDANSTLIAQTAPGGISHTWRTDPAGEPIEQFVTGPLTDPETGASTTGTWLGWSILNDPLGRIALESTPAGAVLDGSDTTTPDGTGGVGDGYGYERAFTYDPLSRLTRVDDLTATTHAGTVNTTPADGEVSAPGVCQTRTYSFDANSNRTALKTTPCGSTTGTTTTWAYNTGDAATTGASGQGAYVYDQFGRQTLIPKADTHMGTADLTLGYYDTDAPRSIKQGTTTTAFTLDPAGRRLVQTTAGQGPFPGGITAKSEIVRHYGDDSDNPTWTSYEGGTTTRFLPGIGGDLGISTTTTGGATVAELTIANPHGDVVSTISLPETGAVTGITAWSDYTEYGTPRTPAANATVSGPLGYGWLGTKERATPGETFGLTLMGVRFYNPATGRFTSTDPIYGGNHNTYTYPSDPINVEDLTGAWGWKKARSWAGSKAKSAWGGVRRAARWSTNSRWGRAIKSGCNVSWGIVAAGCGIYFGGAYAIQGKWRQAGSYAAGSAVGVIGGGAARAGFRYAARKSQAYSSRRSMRRHRYAVTTVASWSSGSSASWAVSKKRSRSVRRYY
ncbi:RHS repeat-associated core domain-containing protein [Serinicoccus profundi]|uniref:RHS repeat-associated core domain-containing protein n=1 Tax=Serinicoccus profundi TaxID=1078471 RepID=UPI00030E61AF|nr:RHS repeat-associated core domain-containing protein [Serinicoccus profundi]